MKRQEYIVLCGQVVGGADRPFDVVYGFDGERFTDRPDAISHGLKIRESDDFNIGVVRGKNLISLDWMNEVVDIDHQLLSGIAEQIGL